MSIKINWSHPLANGLVTAIPFNESGNNRIKAYTRDGIVMGTPTGTSADSWRWHGRGNDSLFMPNVKTTNCRLDYDNQITKRATTGLSIYFLGEFLEDDTTDVWFIADSEDDTSGGGWRLTKGDGTLGMATNEFRFRTPDLTQVNMDSASAWDIGDPMSLLWTWDGANKRFYDKGILSDTSAAATGTITYYNNLLRIGNYTPDDLYVNATGYKLFLIYDRALTPTEAKQLHNNPWQVFAPQLYFAHTQKYFPPAIEAEAPAGNTLTITLVDAAGTTLPNLTGLSWAWFDESTVSTLTAPTAQGTGETTDVSGVLEVDITGTTLGATDTGILTLRDSTGHIYALYRVTLT